MPIAATITTTDIAICMQPGTHGSTFGGNPVSCAVASKLIDIVDDKKLLSGVMEKTIKFIDHLQNLSKKYDFFTDIRSAGLWIAADMKQATSKEFLSRSYEEGLLLVSANGESTLRFAPSLIISDQEIEEGFSKLIVDDAKGGLTPEFKLKQKMMKAIHGIDIHLSYKSKR